MRVVRVPLLIATVAMLVAGTACSTPPEPADMVLLNGDIYTMEPSQPTAKAVAIRGNTIVAVLQSDDEARRYANDKTRVIDLGGKFVVPGFIDGHVHFANAGALINGVNLLTVHTDEGLRNEVKRVLAIVGPNEWLTGGSWGAYEQWAQGAASATGVKKTRWEPSRQTIDDLTPNNPCFLSSGDRELYLANTAALKAAGLETAKLQGMKLEKGVPTGLVYRGSPAIDKIRAAVKPKSQERALKENRVALKALREAGIVEVHDISSPEQEARWVTLQQAGELTARIWMRPDLSRGADLKAKGFTMGVHPASKQRDRYLRYGALKGYIDGIMGNHTALFFEPYNDQPDNYGRYRVHTSDDPNLLVPNMEKAYTLIKTGIDAGFVTNVHSIGDKGSALMLDTYERLMKDVGHPLEGFRVIHSQVLRPQDFPRFKALHVIAEVNPYHISDDMRWMEERIGHERCKGAYAFKTLLDNGATLVFGSDWPGTADAEYYMHPKYLINAAVNRTTLKGEPAGGWFPEQKISVEEALKAYTINSATATFDADVKGSLKAGKLADITVCDRNLLKIDPKDILNMNVDMTIVDGKVVFERAPQRAARLN
jgi:predicted amidohydrolase YtcJ